MAKALCRPLRPARRKEPPVDGQKIGRSSRVLVAGATGYLGSRIVTRLKERGYWVRVLVRRPEQAAALAVADDAVVAQVTEPDSLAGICDGVGTLYSSLGITRQHDGVGYRQVDYGGNAALLREAERAGVRRFAYVSVLHGPEMRGRVRLAAAKEQFVDELRASPIPSTIIRPTAYFSDMEAFLDMARKGWVFVIGDGTRSMNPMSGEDLAVACVKGVESGARELEVGGPDVLSHNEIVRLAFDAAGRKPRMIRIPTWAAAGLGGALARTTPERVYGPVQFFLAVMARDMVAPAHGSDHLESFFAAPRPS